MAARKLQEVVSLQQHVVEFEEGQRLLALKPELHRVEGQHPVDGEVPPIFAQEIDVVEVLQPLVVVDEECVRLPVAESQELLEGIPYPGLVRVDLRFGQKLAAFVLAGRIADLRGAAADQRNRLVPAAAAKRAAS